LRGVVDRIHQQGAELVVVGNGTVEQARAFRDSQKVTFPLLTDPERTSYRAAGLKRGAFLRARVAWNAVKALASGHIQTQILGDPKQHGGAFVFAPGGELRFGFLSEEAGHHPDPEDLVRALGAPPR